jgi:S-formylglutathione hydrolase FrmB
MHHEIPPPAMLRKMKRRLLLLAACGLAAAGIAPATAGAVTLRSWTIDSRFVDLDKVQFNGPAPAAGAPRRRLQVVVSLPDGYDGRRRFPVLYLLHGHGDGAQSWTSPKDGDLARTAAGLKAIVVMPEGAQGWYANWWDAGRRGTDGREWERYFADEVVPLVERRLRILPGRTNRAIAGLSMGGEGATFFASMLPGYFGAVATFSGSISLQRPEWPVAFDTQGQRHVDVFGDPTAQAFYWTGHNPTALARNLAATRVFVRVGDGVPDPTDPAELQNTFGQVAEAELHQHASDFAAATRAAGAPTVYEERQGIHAWRYWRDALRSAITWGFFRPVVERPRRWTYRTVATSGRAWDLGYTFAAPPATVQTFTRDGAVLSATGTGTVRVAAHGYKRFTATLPFRVTLRRATPPRRP